MYIYRPVIRNKIVLLALILAQLCLIVSYFFLNKPHIEQKLNKISFLPKIQVLKKADGRMYYTLNGSVHLKHVTSRGFFLDFNSSMCFTEGTDIKTMIVVKGVNWKCNCLQGWHGPDCGYPEILFRALLASRQVHKVKGPVPFQHRLIYIFQYLKSSDNLVDMRISALGDIIDLFIVYENGSSYFERELQKKAFKKWQHKILYVSDNSFNIWNKVEPHIKNLKDDDYVIFSPTNEILDRASMIFLKFYQNIPEPIYFRLKWSVYGFFWLHPKKTLISAGACTISYLRNTLNSNLAALHLRHNKTEHLPQKGIILGDLNHTGGWYCEYCASPEEIIEYLTSTLINWDKIGTTKITHKFIENLIETGVYVDSKTELERGHRSDVDFAPPYVLENDFKFDFLLVNFYSQNDYYV
ncbi:beta-1,4-mannosyl-glycoprotein 4-beta-N-acetylglucosaminyltransferase [Euwallacea fornicatus]|uniref:beta-1,4-mannosyl-glycoprotein 4-beta-N-acetylglucosaminyltransferase n=1 Tax=Euwallacea fornicatus TaxID=995702 RepID=UPI00338F4DE3